MTKDDVETMYWNHPTIKANKKILERTGTPMFKNQKEKEKSIAMFAVDNKFITRQEMYRLFGNFHDYKPV
jgi:hypothetical protein